MNDQQSTIANSRLWNYVPDLPVRFSPLFDWPPNLNGSLRWLGTVWKPISLYFITLAITLIIYFFFQPPEGTMKEFAFGWIAQIWLRNIILMSLVAGSLHYYFYMLKKQKNDLKYERKGQDANSKIHDFSNQVLDNMFWTLVSGVAIWTAYEVVYFWASANSFVPALTLAGNPVWFVLMFLLIPVWSSLHFYFIHRLLHWPPLFRLAHALHHRNVNIGPWSGISMHPIEHILYFSSFAIHFVIASHPIHMIFHAYFQGLGPAVSHSGFEALKVGGRKRLKLGDYFHQLHHKHYKCNYGTLEMPWDRWFGSFHDGTEDATRRIRKRKW